MANPLYGQNKADSEIAVSSDVSSYLKEYVATAEVETGVVRCIELNHASTPVVLTGMRGIDYAGQIVVIKDTSASGTSAHTVTLSQGTYNAANNNKVTLNAPDEMIAIYFDSNGDGDVLLNIGSVALATV
jgi:hypothetical protein